MDSNMVSVLCLHSIYAMLKKATLKSTYHKISFTYNFRKYKLISCVKKADQWLRRAELREEWTISKESEEFCWGDRNVLYLMIETVVSQEYMSLKTHWIVVSK